MTKPIQSYSKLPIQKLLPVAPVMEPNFLFVDASMEDSKIA